MVSPVFRELEIHAARLLSYVYDTERDKAGAWRIEVTLRRPHRLARSRTPPFHGENRGSNPLGDAKFKWCLHENVSTIFFILRKFVHVNYLHRC